MSIRGHGAIGDAGFSGRRSCRALGAVLLLLLLGCQRPDKSPRPAPAPSPPDPHASVPPLEQQRELLAAAYRPKPDRRFLLAVSSIHALLTGEPRTETRAEFARGAWTLEHGGVEVGRLPEVPSYGDASDLLVKWSGSLLKAHPLADSSIPAATPWDLTPDEDAFTDLEARQRDWAGGGRSGAVLARAAHGLVSLQFHLEDAMELGDAVGEHALALVSIVKALGGAEAIAEDDALLPRAMGYWGAAQERALRLPAGSVVRAFLLRDDPTLEKLVQAPGAGQGSRELVLRRLGAIQDWRRESEWLTGEMSGSMYTVPVVFDALPHADFDRERAMSSALPDLVLLATLRRAGDARATATARDLAAWKDPDALEQAEQKIRGDLGVADAGLLDAFETALAKVGGGLTGALFSASVERAYFKAAMYTGLERGMNHALYHLGSVPAARQYLARWGTGGGDTAADLRTWAQELIDAKDGRHAPTELLSTLRDLPNLGPSAHRKLYDQLVSQANWADTRVLGAARAMAARLDTRLDHRRALVHVAYDGLHDLALTERVGRTLPAEEAPLATREANLVAWITRDVGYLKARLADPALSGADAAPLVRSLEQLGEMTDAQARAELRRRVGLAKDDWQLRTILADYLLGKGAFAEARDAMTPWLAANGDKPGLETLAAKTTLARAYYLEGKYPEAWKLLEPLVPSQYGEAMENASLTLEALGRADDAERVARERLDRYRCVSCVAALAELYWRHGRNDDATKLLVPPTVPMTDLEVRTQVGAAFVRAFARRSDAEAAQAFHGIDAAGPRYLKEVATAVNASGRHDLAFAMASPLSVPGMGNLLYLLRSYEFLQDAKGHEEAVNWLRPRVPPKLLEALSQFAISEGADALLWDVIPTPAATRHDDAADAVWLFRALSVARGASDSHRGEVMAHYQGPAGGRYDVIARYILGLAKESSVLALASKAKDACEAAYWLGRGAQSEGRIVDAAEWYRLSVETGLSQVWEYNEAYNQLTGWWSAGKALSLVQAGK